MQSATRRREINPLTFAASFCALAIVFQLASSTAFADRFVGQPLCSLVARLSALLLSPLGRASVDGTRLGFNDFSVVIAEPCNGILPTILYLAAVLAFPSTWRA